MRVPDLRNPAALLAVGVIALAALAAHPADLDDAATDDRPVTAPPAATVETVDVAGVDAGSTGPATPFVMFTSARHPDGFDADALRRVEAFASVVTATTVRSDTLGLTGSRDADGRTIDEVRAGYRIPVSVLAIDPPDYLSLLGSEHLDTELLALLRPGEILLSTSSALLRRAGPGSRLDVAGVNDLLVIGVIDDALTSGAEILVHADDSTALGLRGPESLIVRHLVDDPSDADALRQSLLALDDDEEIRVWSRSGRVQLVLSLTQVKLRFGEFAYRFRPNQREIDIDPTFVGRNIVTEQVPLLGAVTCHREILEDLRAALAAVEAAGLGEHVAPRRYGGCFVPRRIAVGRSSLSRHSWGIAIDLNVDFDLPGAGAVPPDEFLTIMAAHGFRWGGHFHTPDNHHYEWVGRDLAMQQPPED
jgi:hypothetical protein